MRGIYPPSGPSAVPSDWWHSAHSGRKARMWCHISIVGNFCADRENCPRCGNSDGGHNAEIRAARIPPDNHPRRRNRHRDLSHIDRLRGNHRIAGRMRGLRREVPLRRGRLLLADFDGCTRRLAISENPLKSATAVCRMRIAIAANVFFGTAWSVSNEEGFAGKDAIGRYFSLIRMRICFAAHVLPGDPTPARSRRYDVAAHVSTGAPGRKET